MRGKLYTEKEKEKIKQLLLAGKTYSEIGKLLGVPKSTISGWFGKTLRKPWGRKVMLEHLTNIRKLAATAQTKKWQKKREEEIKLIKAKIEKELKNYPFESIGFYKAMLAMLFWAEGTRCKNTACTVFTNTDPNLALLYITLLRKCHNTDENRFRIELHIHYYHSIKKVKNFWSKMLNVPLSQFNKVYIKKRSKTKRFRKNFAGICVIRYQNSNIKKELIELGSVLQKTITKNAPVAQRKEHLIADQKIAGSIPARRTRNLYLTRWL